MMKSFAGSEGPGAFTADIVAAVTITIIHEVPLHIIRNHRGEKRSAAESFCSLATPFSLSDFSTAIMGSSACNARFQLKLLPRNLQFFCLGIFSKTKEHY